MKELQLCHWSWLAVPRGTKGGPEPVSLFPSPTRYHTVTIVITNPGYVMCFLDSSRLCWERLSVPNFLPVNLRALGLSHMYWSGDMPSPSLLSTKSVWIRNHSQVFHDEPLPLRGSQVSAGCSPCFSRSGDRDGPFGKGNSFFVSGVVGRLLLKEKISFSFLNSANWTQNLGVHYEFHALASVDPVWGGSAVCRRRPSALPLAGVDTPPATLTRIGSVY